MVGCHSNMTQSKFLLQNKAAVPVITCSIMITRQSHWKLVTHLNIRDTLLLLIILQISTSVYTWETKNGSKLNSFNSLLQKMPTYTKKGPNIPKLTSCPCKKMQRTIFLQ